MKRRRKGLQQKKGMVITMEHDRLWFLIRAYFKQKRGFLLLLALMHGVFTLVLFLYRLPLEAVLYAFLLNAVFLSAAGAVSFVRYVRRHRQMEDARRALLYDASAVPPPRHLEDADFLNLIEQFQKEHARIVSDTDAERSEREDYALLWAHQIKTPIAAMRLLLQEEDTERSRELGAELFRIEQYVEMDLNYARLNSHSTDFVIRSYSLDDIVRQALRKYAPLFVRQKLSLSWEPTGHTVLTDEKWLVFVLEQLLSNALKYTPSGMISLYVEDPLTLVIEDTGIGIAAEDLPRICEKGFTGYNGRTDKKATGLGLYLCRRILYQLSHTLSIESQPGNGTRVRIGLEALDSHPE